MPLFLGDLTLDDFEVPADIRFGGKQSLAIHELPGGTRVVDVLGRNDSAIRWSGVLTGARASERARLLDAVRSSGATIALSWDAFSYTVIIEHLALTYTSAWWIPYTLSCVVVADNARAYETVYPQIVASVVADLNQVASLTNATQALSAVRVAGSTTPGTAAYLAANTAVDILQATISRGLADAENRIQSNNLGQIVSEAGVLAQFSAARGYVARIANNLEGANL